MTAASNILLAIIGFSSGALVAGGIFAFIAMIGVVPRFAQKTDTIKFIPLYEDAIILGGILGSTTLFLDYYIPVGKIGAAFIALCIGIFIGCVAVSLAEVLNVVPVFMRRARLITGLKYFIASLALGKMCGSLLYLLGTNFYK